MAISGDEIGVVAQHLGLVRNLKFETLKSWQAKKRRRRVERNELGSDPNGIKLRGKLD
jgi:hypothetical protein